MNGALLALTYFITPRRTILSYFGRCLSNKEISVCRYESMFIFTGLDNNNNHLVFRKLISRKIPSNMLDVLLEKGYFARSLHGMSSRMYISSPPPFAWDVFSYVYQYPTPICMGCLLVCISVPHPHLHFYQFDMALHSLQRKKLGRKASIKLGFSYQKYFYISFNLHFKLIKFISYRVYVKLTKY